MTWSLERDGSLALLRVGGGRQDWTEIVLAVDRALEDGARAVAVPRSVPDGTAHDQAMLEALSRRIIDRGVGVMWTAASGSYRGRRGRSDVGGGSHDVDRRVSR